MSQKGRVKRDKWREELAQAEHKHARWVAKVNALEREQEILRAREHLLLQMIEGLRVISDSMVDYIKQQQQYKQQQQQQRSNATACCQASSSPPCCQQQQQHCMPAAACCQPVPNPYCCQQLQQQQHYMPAAACCPPAPDLHCCNQQQQQHCCQQASSLPGPACKDNPGTHDCVGKMQSCGSGCTTSMLDLDWLPDLHHEQQQQQQQPPLPLPLHIADAPLDEVELKLLQVFLDIPQHQQRSGCWHRTAVAVASDQQQQQHGSSEANEILQRAHRLDLQIDKLMQSATAAAAAAATPSAAAAAAGEEPSQEERIQLLGRLFAHDTLRQVLSMSASQMLTRMRDLVGQCAILSFQGNTSSHWHTPAAAPSPAVTSSGSGAGPRGSVALAGPGSPGSSAASGGSSGSSAAVEQFTIHPAFEFVAIKLGAMLFEPQKFHELRVLEMQSQSQYNMLPAGFWQEVADKLELSDQQVRRLIILRELTLPKLASVAANIGQAATEQHAAIDAQLAQLQKLSLEDRSQQPQQQRAAHMTWQQLQQAQESLVMQQEANMATVMRVSLTIGMGSIAILTFKQMALFIAASYPSSPRMDQLMAAVATLPKYQQHQSKQQQQQPQKSG